MSYKKRGQAGWAGKKEAKTKTYKERNYAKEEIRKEMKMIEEGEDYRDRAGGRNKNRIKSLEYWRDYYYEKAEKAKERGDNCKYFGYSSYKSSAERMEKEIEREKAKILSK